MRSCEKEKRKKEGQVTKAASEATGGLLCPSGSRGGDGREDTSLELSSALVSDRGRWWR